MFVKSVLYDHIKLKAHEIGKNFKDVLTVKIKDVVEGKCTRYGYVVPDSVYFLNCSCGKLDGASLNGDVVYEVEYQATVCNPAENSVVSAKVVNVNRFGILAHGGFSASMPTSNVLEIIIAKQGVALTSEVNLDKIKIGDTIQVQILGKRFELNDVKISVVGKVLSASSAPIDNAAKTMQAASSITAFAIDDNNDSDLDRDSTDILDSEDDLDSDQDEKNSDELSEQQDDEDDEGEDADDVDEDEDDTFLSDDVADDASGEDSALSDDE